FLSLLLFAYTHHTATHSCTLSLHDALPISRQACDAPVLPAQAGRVRHGRPGPDRCGGDLRAVADAVRAERDRSTSPQSGAVDRRSEEHTSELQSRENLVCRLLLEKKKEKNR